MMRILLAFFIALLPMAAVASEPVQPKAPKPILSRAVPIRHITPGIEVLLSDRLELLAGKRVALLSNQTGVNRKGVRNIDLLRAHPAINLVALFSPEHGVRGVAQAGEKVASGLDSKSGLPVHSLYGDTKMPTAKMMQGIDIVLVDLQDIGTRFYTYSSTLLYMLRAAETSGAEVIVLDRPNPLGGMMIEGPVLEPAFASFVGSFAMPVRHGMTFGELAQMFVGENKLRTRLHIIPMRGWYRNLTPYAGWDLPWVPPSPNMRSPKTAAVYPGTALFEGTNISEGRGSEKPFEYIGAPFIDGSALVKRLNAMGLPGVAFEPASFKPDFSKYAGQDCHGVWVIPTNSKTFHPFRTGIALVKTVHDMYPDKFEFHPGTPAFFEQLAGTDSVRKGILEGKSVSDIERQWQPELDAFMSLRARYLIYS